MDDGQHGADRGLTGRLWRPAVIVAVLLGLGAGLVAWAPAVVTPMPAFFLKLLGWTVALAAPAWFCLKALRAGIGHARRGGKNARGYAVAGVAALGAVLIAAKGMGLAKADLGVAMTSVQVNLPITTAIRPLNGGTELLFDGNIEHGAAKALREVAARLPHVRRIRLGGMGGELREAREIRDLIAEKGWDTHISGICWSGCAIAYLGGARRTMSAGAQMGFHSASVWPVRSEERETAINDAIAREMIARGIDPAFARRAWSKSHDGMWFPSSAELVGAGLVHQVIDR